MIVEALLHELKKHLQCVTLHARIARKSEETRNSASA